MSFGLGKSSYASWRTACLFALGGGVICERWLGRQMPKLLVETGEASYSMYLTHGFVLPAIGIALAKSAIAAADLAAGTVVKPFELSVPVGFAHYLVCPAGKAKLPKVELFRDWLKRDAEVSG